jgi:hypothetical protein
MKKIMVAGLVLLSSALYGETIPPTHKALSHPINISALEAQLQSLQAQINTLKKGDTEQNTRLSTLQKGDAQQNTLLSTIQAGTKPIVQLDSQDPYILMDKPLFAAMPSPSFVYSALQAKDKLNAPIVIGGKVESDLQAWGGNTIPLASPIKNNSTYQSGSGVSLTNATLVTAANISRYATAIVFLSADAPSYTITAKRAMLILGNLKDSPFYFSIGRNYLPFGLFPGNAFLQNSLITNTMRPGSISQAIFSYAANGFNIDTGVYQNPGAQYYNYSNGVNTAASDNGSSLSNYFGNIRYKKQIGDTTYAFGTGFLSDIRQTGSGLGNMYTNPPAFTSTSGSQPFVGKRNPLIDVNAVLTYKLANIFAEYTKTLESAQYYGVDTGQFSAWIIGTSYSPNITFSDKIIKSYMQVNYSGTENMNNVSQGLLGDVTQSPTTLNNGIRRQAMTQFTFEVLHNVYMGPELQYDWLYSGATTWVTSFDITAVF